MITMYGKGAASEIAKELKSGIMKSASTCDLKEWMIHPGDEGEIHIQVFEQYFYRVKSYVSLTVVLADRDEGVLAQLAGSGGGGGLFNISWGANDDFAITASNVLRSMGFKATTQA